MGLKNPWAPVLFLCAQKKGAGFNDLKQAPFTACVHEDSLISLVFSSD